jgi:ABC-type glycerol-3-phosphate transport system substrate-binding protein
MSVDQHLNRRRVLRLGAGISAASILAACGGTPAAPTTAPKAAEPAKPAAPAATTAPAAAATTAPAGAAKPAEATKPAAAGAAKPVGGKVYTMVDKVWADVGMLEATKVYNEAIKASGTEIVLEETAQGWDTKVLAQIKDKQLRWSGHGYSPFFDSHKNIKAGLVEPLDDYLKASKVPWASKQKEVYFSARVYDALLWEGKQYYIPMKANVHLAGWRQDYVEKAGYDTLPKTWDETEKMFIKMKEVLAKDEVTPLAIQRDLYRTIGTTFTTFIENPLDDNGTLKFESPEWIAVLEMFKKWTDQGLAMWDTGNTATDAWQKGKLAMNLTSHSWVRLGRQAQGNEKVKGGRPPKANASAPDRTWVHIDSGFVFPGAPNPQETVDWLLTILGPEGAPAETWWKGVTTFSGQPAHQPMIEKVLKTNPLLTEVYDIMGAVPNSMVINLNAAGNFLLMQTKMLPHLDRMFKGEVSAKEAMAATRKEFDAEVAKQKA